MRIGCLFGSFDPPHNGHVAIADHMRAAQGLDEVWLIVTPQSPFKKERPLTPDHHRLAMVRLAVQGHEGLVAAGFEIDLPKPSFTVDSLRFMRHRWPDHVFDLIIGSDNLAGFHGWKDPDAILEIHRLLVYPRTGLKDHLDSTIYRGHPGVRVVADAPLTAISSTAIREGLKAWSTVDDQLPKAVLQYIREHRLYTS